MSAIELGKADPENIFNGPERVRITINEFTRFINTGKKIICHFSCLGYIWEFMLGKQREMRRDLINTNIQIEEDILKIWVRQKSNTNIEWVKMSLYMRNEENKFVFKSRQMKQKWVGEGEGGECLEVSQDDWGEETETEPTKTVTYVLDITICKSYVSRPAPRKDVDGTSMEFRLHGTSMESLLESDEGKDIDFRVYDKQKGYRTFSAHTLVLRNREPDGWNALESFIIKEEGGGKRYVNIELDVAQFDLLLKLVYGKNPDVVNWDEHKHELVSMIEVASRYGFYSVRDELESRLVVQQRLVEEKLCSELLYADAKELNYYKKYVMSCIVSSSAALVTPGNNCLESLFTSPKLTQEVIEYAASALGRKRRRKA